MTAHPSHKFGEVSGSVCCVVCFVGPDWPLAERHCDGELGEPLPPSLRTRTRMHKNSVDDSVIAAALERGEPTKTIAVSLKAGKARITRIAREIGIAKRPIGRPRKQAAR